MPDNTFTKLYQQVTTCVNNEQQKSPLFWNDKLALVPDKNNSGSSNELSGKVEIRGWWRRRGCWIWSQAYRNMAEKTLNAISSEYGNTVATRVFKSVVGDPKRNQQVTLKQFHELKHRLQFEGKISMKRFVRESIDSLNAANNISQHRLQPGNDNNPISMTLYNVPSGNATSDIYNIEIEAVKPRPDGGTKYSEVSKQIKLLVKGHSDKSKHIRFKAPSWDQERIYLKSKRYRRFNRHMVRKRYIKHCHRGSTGGFYLHKPTLGSSLGIGNWWSGESPQKKREATGRAIYESLCNEYGNKAANLIFQQVFPNQFTCDQSRLMSNLRLKNNLKPMIIDIVVSIEKFNAIEEQVKHLKEVLDDCKNNRNNGMPSGSTKLYTVRSGQSEFGSDGNTPDSPNESETNISLVDSLENDTSEDNTLSELENDSYIEIRTPSETNIPQLEFQLKLPKKLLEKANANKSRDKANNNRNEQ
ncbi:MAG: hypothetical protein MI861_16900 [Pirellulales bacterium]|nr:hypothetical protein [Pirellulales bacterium]